MERQVNTQKHGQFQNTWREAAVILIYYWRHNVTSLGSEILEAAFLLRAPHFPGFYQQETYVDLLINSRARYHVALVEGREE